MIKVYCDGQSGIDYLYDLNDSWKEYCGVENFDETYVIKGNDSFHAHDTAEWYQKALELGSDLNLGCEKVDFPDLTDDQYKKAKEIYDKCRCFDDDKTVIEFLGVLYPNEEFETTTIRGYVQRDWQEVIYKKTPEVNIKLLEAMYFGMLTEIWCEDEDGVTISGFVTDDQFWEAENNGTLKELVRDVLDIPSDEPIEIYKADGVIKTTNWTKIGD